MIYAIIAVLVCGLDQLTKYAINRSLDWYEEVEAVPGILRLTRCQNSGGAFSMLSDYTWVLTVISIACTGLFIFLLTRKWLGKGEKIALSMVLGGAVGNAIDRIIYGKVVDMFIFVPTGLSVFNVADIFICVGGGLFCLLYLIKIFKEDKFHHPAMKGGEMPELKRLAARQEQARDGDSNEDNG